MQESRVFSYLAGGLMAAAGAAALLGRRGPASVLHLAPILLLAGAAFLFFGLHSRRVGWVLTVAGSSLTCILLGLDAARRLEPTRLVDTLLAFALFGGGLGILAHAQARCPPVRCSPGNEPPSDKVLDATAPEDSISPREAVAGSSPEADPPA